MFRGKVHHVFKAAWSDHHLPTVVFPPLESQGELEAIIGFHRYDSPLTQRRDVALYQNNTWPYQLIFHKRRHVLPGHDQAAHTHTHPSTTVLLLLLAAATTQLNSQLNGLDVSFYHSWGLDNEADKGWLVVRVRLWRTPQYVWQVGTIDLLDTVMWCHVIGWGSEEWADDLTWGRATRMTLIIDRHI